jgi:Methyltransferase domain
MLLLDRLLPARWQLRHRSQLLNHLIATRGYRRYLEIGVRTPGDNFDRVRAPLKHGVDPAARGPVTFPVTSDQFFFDLDSTAPDTRYDLVFIDGLHLAEQVERDVVNSLAHLAPGGAIVLHDCNPLTRDAQSDDYDGLKHWNGTVWKAWAKLRATRPDLSMVVVDIDEGCGVITEGQQRCFSLATQDFGALDFAYLEAHRRELLNLVPVRDFLARAP